ncbi:MAG: hypothetical protein HYT22_03605 [Candidatus Niyogibacteria bacterium]|nr:hypothetical protein [Candidatus Niyogibacteria bacterium]
MKNFVIAIFSALLLAVPFGAFAEQVPANSGPSPDTMYQKLAMHYVWHVAPLVGEAGVERLRAKVAFYPFHGIGITMTTMRLGTSADPLEVVITGLWKDSPAAVAGIHGMDRIVAVNGQAVSCSDTGDECTESVRTAILGAPETFVLEVLRGDERRSFTLTKTMIGLEILRLAGPRMLKWNEHIRAQETAAKEFVTRMVASAGNLDESFDARSMELSELSTAVNQPFDEFQEIVDSFLIRE